jgi:hypothetical protein
VTELYIGIFMVVAGYGGGAEAGSGTMADGRWLWWWSAVTVVTEVENDCIPLFYL